MRVDVLSKEYPPEIYGGAGVHVAELVRALRARDDLTTHVHAFGAPRDEPGTSSYGDLAELAGANAALRTLGVDLAIADGCAGTDLVHSHTWYANLAGHLAALLHGVPHVVSAHSLEPMRPWKAEQLGGGYAVSSWVERTAYESAAAVIAVSAAMRDDVLRSYPAVDPARVQVVHNGIDTELWSPRARARTGCASWVSTPTARRWSSSAGSPGRRGCPSSCARWPSCRRRCRWCSAPARPTPPRSWRRSRRWSPTCAPAAPASSGSPRCSPAPTSSPCSPRPRCSPARRSTSRSASSTSRRWRARPPWSPPPPAASPRSSCRRPAGWCRSSRPPTAPAPPSTRTATSPTSPPRSPTVLSDPDGAAVLGRAGRQRAIDAFSWTAIAERTVDVYRTALG